MTNSITTKLNGVIDNYRISQEDTERLGEYEKANKEFKKMVKNGLILKKGYNLKTVEDSHLATISFNSTAQ